MVETQTEHNIEKDYLEEYKGSRVVIEDRYNNLYRGVLLDIQNQTATLQTARNIVLIYNITFISDDTKKTK